MLTTLCRTTSSTRTWRISSSSWARSASSSGCCSLACFSSPATDRSLRCVGPAGLLHGPPVDLLARRTLREASVGALGAVSLGQVHVEGEALPGGRGPFDHPLEDGAGGDGPPPAEVDHLAVQPEANGPPEVLLDLALAQRLRACALVEIDRGLSDAGGDHRRDVERLVAARLRVANPH